MTETSWMPPTGRHAVNVGGSLARALKARKGLPTKPSKNKNLPVSDFYMCRYNFKPESMDTTKPGTVEVMQGNDVSTVRMERGSFQPEEVHVFRGKAEPAKEVDCVLIYNEEDGMFTLEKLDSFLTMSHDGRAAAKNRPPSASPLPTPSPAPSASRAEQDDLPAELDRELLTTVLDAEGDVDDELNEIVPASQATPKPTPKPTPVAITSTSASAYTGSVNRKRALEEEIPIPPQLTAKPKPKLRASNKPTTLTVSKSAPPKGKGKGKRDVPPDMLDVEEEDLEFGQPAKQLKCVRAAPIASGAAGVLALPTTSDAVHLPAAPVAPMSAMSADVGSESEEEWDEVRPSGAEAEAEGSIFGDGEEDGGEEIDLNLFEAEMNLELEEDGADEDGDEGLFGAEPETPGVGPVVSGKPMSLNQFLGGGVAEQDDDDYSSSDDSDDD